MINNYIIKLIDMTKTLNIILFIVLIVNFLLCIFIGDKISTLGWLVSCLLQIKNIVNNENIQRH
jgi:hypothetical protein